MPWSMINKWLKFNTVCVCLFHHVRHNLLCSLNSILIRQLREGQCVCVCVCACVKSQLAPATQWQHCWRHFVLQSKAYPAYTLVLFCTKEINIHSECSSRKRGKKITNEKNGTPQICVFIIISFPLPFVPHFSCAPLVVCVLALLSIVLFNIFVKWLTFSFSPPSLGLEKS